jgi:hypothetical protein
MIETNVSCGMCDKYGRHPLKEEDIVCMECYNTLESDKVGLEDENSSLRKDIEDLENKIYDLEYYKNIVMNNPELYKIVIADKL